MVLCISIYLPAYNSNGEQSLLFTRGESLPESGRFTRRESKLDKLEIYKRRVPA
jgi:hypothetical protein